MCDFIYDFNGDGVNLLKYIGNDKNVIVPNMIDGEYVIGIYKDCFINNENIESVIIEGAVFIDNGAFANCINLKNVKLPKDLMLLGQGVFFNCINLEEIVIPSSIDYLNPYMFYNCKKLKKVKLKGLMKSIGDSCFDRCSSLEEINIKGKNLELYNYVFYGCENLKKVVISGVNNVKKYIFKKCKSLKEVILKGEDVFLNIENMFEDCDSLETVYFKNEVYVEDKYIDFDELNIVNESKKKCKFINLNERDYIKKLIKDKII